MMDLSILWVERLWWIGLLIQAICWIPIAVHRAIANERFRQARHMLDYAHHTTRMALMNKSLAPKVYVEGDSDDDGVVQSRAADEAGAKTIVYERK